jgi:uncharacterized membrane protein required for colicin V production
MQWQNQLQNLSVAPFDLVVVIVVLVGILRGRKHGMSEELLPLFQWLVIIILGGYTYAYCGKFLRQLSGMDLTLAYVISYVTLAVLTKWVFTVLKHALGDKLLSSDAFGRAEYALGMTAGILRYGCILIFCLSLLSALYVSESEKVANKKMQEYNFGKQYIPSLGSIQDSIFKESLCGRKLKQHLALLLIQPVPKSPPAGETLGKRKEKALDEVMGNK